MSSRSSDAAKRPTGVVAFPTDLGMMCAAQEAMESAGVTFEDERCAYVQVNIDRELWLTWKSAKEADDAG